MKNKQLIATRSFSAAVAVLLMVVGCGKETEQPRPRVTDEAVPPAAVDEQPAAAVREKTDTSSLAKDPEQAESIAPTSMDQLLNRIEARIESDKEYVAKGKEADATTQRELGQQRKTYTVRPGDSLASIANAHYNDPAMYMAIYEENQDILPDPNSLEVGQDLELPQRQLHESR